MSLQIWLPLNGDLHNQGLNGNLAITTIGTVAYDNAGKIGKCFISGGTSQITNGININNNLIDILNSPNGSSIALWVKPAGNHVNYNGTFISSGNWNSTCWTFGVSQNNSQVDMFCKGYNAYITCAVPVNEWTHLVGVFKDGVSKLYKNGVYVGEVTGKTAFASDASNTCIGRETYASGYFGFNGKINDVRIYDHALSAKEVEEISKGLILHYKLDDRFCEPTTNLITTEDGLSNICYNRSKGEYGYGTNTDMYKTTGVFNGRFSTKVYMGTAGQAAYPFVFFDPFNAKETEIQTLSFDYYPTAQDKLIAYSVKGTYNFSYTSGIHSGSGTNIKSVTIPVTVGTWNHITLTAQKTDPTNTARNIGYLRIGDAAHTSTTTNYWLFANIQVENKDHATGYAGINGSRTPTTIYDCSGYGNDGTIIGNLTVAAGSPRYGIATQFPGDSFIKKSDFYIGNIWTLSCWFYSPSSSSKNWSALIALNNTEEDSDSKFSMYYNQSTKVLQYSANGTYDTTTSTTKDAWHHIVAVFNGSVLLGYLDGIQKVNKTIPNAELNKTNLEIGARCKGANFSSNSTPFEGKMSDIRIYTTAFTPEQVADLYHTSMSIDNQGNIYARELIEL